MSARTWHRVAGWLGRAWLVGGACSAAWGGGVSGRIDFDREIRPILSENCYACHGPDDQARKAGLRLDQRAGALKEVKGGGFAIVPGRPDQSKLVSRITTKDPEEVMPPPRTGKKLKTAQIELLRRWVAGGAAWPVHWAFAKPERPSPPAVKNPRWERNEIDRFVLARLEHEGLTPSPEADKATLIRRVSLDLTGMPPTVEEIDGFLADQSPHAYDQLVDRLLASRRLGEEMARYWLDVARYADSHGYHIDSQRDIWAYRDYVINAFNANKRFDQFTIEQLAGDLLPNPTTEQKVATGYLRCNMSTGEGGAIEAEYQAKYGFDRTETTSTIWLGLTLTCARCHSHKYDPLTQTEYYRLFAFFNTMNVPIMDDNRPNPDPFLKLPSPEQEARVHWLKAQIKEGQAKTEAPRPELDDPQAAWMKQLNEQLGREWVVLTPSVARSTVTNGATLTVLSDRSILARDLAPTQEVYEVTARPGANLLGAIRLEAIPDDTLPLKGSGRSEKGQFRLAEFEAELLLPGEEKPTVKKLKFSRVFADTAEAKFEAQKAIDGQLDTAWGVGEKAVTEPHTAVFVLAEPVSVPPDAEVRVRLRHQDAGAGHALGRFRLSVVGDGQLTRWLHPISFGVWHVLGPLKMDDALSGLDHSYEPEQAIDLKKAYPGVREDVRWQDRPGLEDGETHLLVDILHGVHGAYYLYRQFNLSAPQEVELRVHADDLWKFWVNGELAAERRTPSKAGDSELKLTVHLPAGENHFLVKVVKEQGSSYFAFKKRFLDASLVPPDIAAILSVSAPPPADWTARVRDQYRRQHSAEFKSLLDELEAWRQEEKEQDQAVPTTLIAKEMEKPRETHLLKRGEYDKPGDVVTPGVPAILPPLPSGGPTNRLALAKWLVDPANPLTARVIVNRFWQQCFGLGLVKTVEDFGVQGERPSHPELLDWLATEFERSGWDVKRMLRLIVTSATYRQSAQGSKDLYRRDPENRLLARGPRFRMDAEVLRDSMLEMSGLLVDQCGGPSVKPYEPPGLWEAVSYENTQKYVPDLGPSAHRRSLYTYWKRQSPPPNMLLFDAPTREYCVARRARTNTPLQALDLLNDPQYVEAARALAQRMLLEGGLTASERLAWGFRLATGRRPAKDELGVLLRVLTKEITEYRAHPAAADRYLSVGAFKPAPSLDRCELAAWTTLANLLLNLDETITKG